jgi:segregation and condensation protein B
MRRMSEENAVEAAESDATDAPSAGSRAPGASGSASGGAAPIDPDELALQVEAVLMTSDRPLPTPKLVELLAVGGQSSKAITAAVEALNRVYEETRRSFRVEAVAGGWQILTLPRFAPVLAALHRSREQTRLSPAALETLAIIAYKQPVLRAEIEAIRGVASGEVIRSLMERHLVRIAGRAEELGRPMLYGTTKTFLEVFGLASLKDLPSAEELKPKAS